MLSDGDGSPPPDSSGSGSIVSVDARSRSSGNRRTRGGSIRRSTSDSQRCRDTRGSTVNGSRSRRGAQARRSDIRRNRNAGSGSTRARSRVRRNGGGDVSRRRRTTRGSCGRARVDTSKARSRLGRARAVNACRRSDGNRNRSRGAVLGGSRSSSNVSSSSGQVSSGVGVRARSVSSGASEGNIFSGGELVTGVVHSTTGGGVHGSDVGDSVIARGHVSRSARESSSVGRAIRGDGLSDVASEPESLSRGRLGCNVGRRNNVGTRSKGGGLGLDNISGASGIRTRSIVGATIGSVKVGNIANTIRAGSRSLSAGRSTSGASRASRARRSNIRARRRASSSSASCRGLGTVEGLGDQTVGVDARDCVSTSPAVRSGAAGSTSGNTASGSTRSNTASSGSTVINRTGRGGGIGTGLERAGLGG